MSNRRSSVHALSYCAGLIAASLFFLKQANAASFFPGQTAAHIEKQNQAKQALDQGVEAFKNGQYNEAEQLFSHAKQLDSNLVSARLYLATTYAAQYIPGAPSDENVKLGHQAIEEFKGVLALDPRNISALDGAGSIAFQMGGTSFNPDLFQESKTYFRKHIQIQPNDPEPYFWIGVIDWTLAFRANGELRAEFKKSAIGEELHEADPLPTHLQVQYAKEFGPAIDEGIDSMKKAIALRPDYDDAMAYLNLLYRRKADVVVSEADREEFIKMAEDLVEKVKDIKQGRATPQEH